MNIDDLVYLNKDLTFESKFALFSLDIHLELFLFIEFLNSFETNVLVRQYVTFESI